MVKWVQADICEICGYDLYDLNEHIWEEQPNGEFKISCVGVIMLEDNNEV